MRGLFSGKGTIFIERDDLMSSVAYWYQTEPHKRWPALPSGLERLPFRHKNLVVGYKVVAEVLTIGLLYSFPGFAWQRTISEALPPKKDLVLTPVRGARTLLSSRSGGIKFPLRPTLSKAAFFPRQNPLY